jgi:hypothetical protein
MVLPAPRNKVAAQGEKQIVRTWGFIYRNGTSGRNTQQGVESKFNGGVNADLSRFG